MSAPRDPRRPWPLPAHFPEYGAEFLGTAALVFFGLSAVVFNLGAGSPLAAWIPDVGWRRLVTGLCFAGTGSLIALSPLGKLSGAHINPSVSIAFWADGKMHAGDCLGYLLAQFLGGIAGAAALAWAWGARAASVHNGMTLPGPGVSEAEAFALEAALTALYLFLVFLFVSSQRLVRWTPLMNWVVFALLVWTEAPLTGTGANPARSLGPALVSGVWRAQWIYLLAPPLGGLIGLACFRLLQVRRPERHVLTGKLTRAPRYRSLFRGEKISQRPAPKA